MAIGNIGNLLQHFVALEVACRVVRDWNQPDEAIEYIDCYAMAPWETITGKQPQGFVSIVRAFNIKADSGDFASHSFRNIWQAHYEQQNVPDHPSDRDYPNTAVLLAESFPNQQWMMRLHENDSSESGKQAQLKCWAKYQPNGVFKVEGDWQQSPEICNNPASRDRPVIVMLDPYRIVADRSDRSNMPGYLREGRLRFLCGQHALALCTDDSALKAPVVIILLSYSDVNPDDPNRIVRKQFSDGWIIEHIRSGPWKLQGRDSFHQCWIVSRQLKIPTIGEGPQTEWDRWCS